MNFIIIGAVALSVSLFNYWVYPVSTIVPFSKSWHVSSPGDGIDLVASPLDSKLIGTQIATNEKIFLVSGYPVDRKTVNNHTGSKLFSTNVISSNGQECGYALPCEEIPIGTKFNVKEAYHLKYIRGAGFFNSDYDTYLITDQKERLIELPGHLLYRFDKKN